MTSKINQLESSDLSEEKHPTETKCDALAVSVTEFCRLTSIGRSTAFQLIRTGAVVSAKLGRRRVVTVASIKALIGRNSTRGPLS